MSDIEKEQERRAWEQAESEDEKAVPEAPPTPEKKEVPRPKQEQSPQKPSEEQRAEADFKERSSFESEVSPEQKEVSLEDIEQVLQMGLEGMYKDFPDSKKQEFKSKGEVTAQRAFDLLNRSHPKPGKITKMIKSWLSTAPDLSDFFVEQEAKTKTDKLMHIINKDHEQ